MDQPVVVAELAEVDFKLAARFFDSVSKGDLFVAQLLHTRYGVELNARNAKGQNALHIACEKGYRDIVQWLLNQVHKGLEKVDNLGFCTIHHAVARLKILNLVNLSSLDHNNLLFYADLAQRLWKCSSKLVLNWTVGPKLEKRRLISL